MDKIYRRPTQLGGAPKKKKNEKNRTRNVIMNFRVSPKEKELIEGGADKIVHTGINDNNLLRLALLDINHLGDKRTALCHHCPTEFEMELDTLGEG